MIHSRGFSLVELIAVLFIISLAAGVVLLKAAGPLNSASMRDVIDQIAGFDRLTRSYCLEHDRSVKFLVNLAAGEITRTDAEGAELLGEPLVLPRQWVIARLLVGEEDVEVGSMEIAFSRAGLSRSYALLLEGPGGRRQWIVVPGLTGLVVGIDDESEVRAILDATRKRPDAG